MKVSLGDAVGNDRLREMRGQLISDDGQTEELERERWESFVEASNNIQESVEGQDLQTLVVSVRRMKNLLRRPSVRRDLAKLEGQEDTIPSSGNKDKEAVKGSCTCSACGAKIDGYRECVDGALCSKCALKKRETPPGESDDKKSEKKAKKAIPFPPEMVGMGGGGDDTTGADDTSASDEPEEKPEPSAKADSGKVPPALRKSKLDKKKKKKKKVAPGDEDEMEMKGGGKKQRRNESKLRRRDYRRALEDFGL